MFKRSRFVTAAAAVVLAGGIAAGTAAAASAGTTPSPADTPTVYPTVTPTPPVHVRPVVTPWQFDLQQSDIGRAPALNITVNDVESGRTGILMRNWRDVQLNPFVDRFQRGPNSVTLLHSPISAGTLDVNLRTCSATIDQDNGRFRIIAGTGTGAGFRSVNGRFDLRALFSWDVRPRTGVCPLAFVSDGDLLRFIQGPGSSTLLPEPSFVDVAVQGRADLVRTRPVIHPFSPVASTDTPTA